MKSDPLLSHLINTNVRCMLLFQWFYYVELCMDMNTRYNNTNRLFPLGFGILRRTTAYILVGVLQGEGQGKGGKWDSSDNYPNGTCLKIFATEAHRITRKYSISKAFFFRVFLCASVAK
jgi:hypothetical protein